MATFFRTSTVWVVDFRYEGRPRRWFKPARPDADMAAEMASLLQEMYGERAQLVAVRPASPEEELQYLRGEEPKNKLCPGGRCDWEPPPPH